MAGNSSQMEFVPGLVSVVIATYNRSNVLRLAIESIRWQAHRNFEIIVVGDSCTDDTADVVAAFEDPAIRFFNLPQNFGEQSGPNNFGCRQARGEFIAFLNHDDLYFPHHLEEAVRLLQDAHLDLVFARRWSVDGPEGRTSVRPPSGRFEYEPTSCVPASCWVFRRELIDDIGPWRAAAELYNMPSQDWIFRAFKAGKKIRCTRDVGIVVISSLVVDNTYRDRRDIEQRAYYELLRTNPDRMPVTSSLSEPRRPGGLRRGAALLARRRTWRGRLGTSIFLASVGFARCVDRVFGRHVHPTRLQWFIKGRGRKGALIETLRERRGLPSRAVEATPDE
jgi:glycosyltransferase involved in cell wall biosynthesis